MSEAEQTTWQMSGDDQDPLDSPDDVETEKQYEEEPEALPDDAGVNGED